MARRAVDGIQRLIEQTAGPKVTATCTVDQVYAEYQHEAFEFRHPRGGRAKYLEAPLYEEHGGWMEQVAIGLLTTFEEKSTAHLWGDVMGDGMRDAVKHNAPDEFGDLRKSAAIKVKEGSKIIIDRPPEVRRLTDEELEQKDDLREMLGMKENYRR